MVLCGTVWCGSVRCGTIWSGKVWYSGKAKEAPSCCWRKWLYTQIGALTPTHFDAHRDDDDDNEVDDSGIDDSDNIVGLGLPTHR